MAKGKYLRAPSPEEQKSRKRSLIGSIIFYTIYALAVLTFVIGVFYGLGLLEDWLIKYEASQPHQKSREVFEQLFSDPDWQALYTMAGEEDTLYEGKEAYAVYMEQYADAEITYMETSAGLSGNKKYIVKAGDEKIATFTLTGGAESQTDIPVWELGDVEIFYDRTESVTVEKYPGYTVYVNGVALDDSFTIHTVQTVAEEYLPEGLHGYRLETQYIAGFLTEPEVTVTDENGNSVTTVYDEEADIYRMLPAAMEISEEEKALVLSGAETYCKWMIRAVYSSALQACFDTNSDIYYVVRTNDTWMQDYLSYEFQNQTVLDYYRYSDTLFTARVQLSLFVTRMNGTVKEYTLDTNFFFTRNDAGNYLITDMTNVDIQQKKEQVRLTFMDGDSTLDSFFVDSEARQLTLPSVTVPEGKVFSGWVRQEDDGNGKITLTVVFEPDENGTVYLSDDNVLSPMTLYTLFDEGVD